MNLNLNFTSGLMINPFSLESDALVNFATGVVLPDDVAETLVNSTKKGQNQMYNFIEERINSKTTSFWDSIPNNKVKTFSFASKKVSVSLSSQGFQYQQVTLFTSLTGWHQCRR